MKKIAQIILFLMILFPIQILGQDKFPNTLSYNESSGSPAAKLSVISWLQGHWKGQAFGGITEEIWTQPLGGSMMGAFKLVVNGKVKFYELQTITEENGTLIIRLKHFHSNMKGWEEKDKTVDFKLVKVTDNKVYFEGFTFEKVNEKEINFYVVIHNGKEVKEMKFNYKKVKR